MRFLLRSLVGALIVVALAFGALSFGVSRYGDAMEEAAVERPRRPAPERVYTIRDQTLEPVTITPVMTAYGTLQAGRTLELRAAQPGKIVDIAGNFRDGARITGGTLLVRVDPATTRSREADALNAVADARSRESQAVQAVALAEAELAAAQRQLDLWRGTLKRKLDLANRGIVARATIEADQRSLASADQAVITRRQALVNARKQVEQTRLAVDRANLTVNDSRRNVADTTITAPFDGVLDQTNAVLGRLVGTNETLGRLIDLTALEVAFRVSDAQFSRLLDENGALLPLESTVSLALGERKIEARAVLDRIAATTEAEGGRTVYATIAASGGTTLRPGDFVSVEVSELPLTGVAQIPARAATEDGRIYLIDEDNRLEEVEIRILRRMADTLIIGDAPFGERIVAELRPQLGPGIKVQNPEEALVAQEEAKKKAAERNARRFGGGDDTKPSGKPGGRPEGKGPPEGVKKPDGKTDGGGRPAKPAGES
jgi:RND family efflux transporter MFP subunit